jgi:hypothetical protein
MTGQKKQPDRVVSQLSLWENLDALGDALGVDLPLLENDATGMSSRLSQLDAQLQHAATHAASDALPPRVASLVDNTATQKDYAERIIKLLEKVCYSRNAYSVFYDWTSLVEAALDMLPTHLASAAQHGRLAEDAPEVARLFERLRASYRPADFEVFAQAFALLLESTEWGYMDVLGEVFMLFTHPNPRLGQYFTPWPVSSLLAELAVPSGERDVHERLKEAISKSPLAEAALLAGTLFREEEADWFRKIKMYTGSHCHSGTGNGWGAPLWLKKGLVSFTWAENTATVGHFLPHATQSGICGSPRHFPAQGASEK